MDDVIREKKVSVKHILFRGIISLLIAILFFCISFLALIDGKYNLKTYFAIYTFSSIVSLMFLSIMFFILTNLISVFIMFFNKKFSIKRLYSSVYEYYGEGALVTSISMFLLFYLDIKVNTIVLQIIVFIVGLVLLFQYYKRLISFAGVDKIPAKIITIVKLVINIFFIVAIKVFI